MHLVIGPSNAGKSTWIERENLCDVVFAFQFVEGEIPPRGSVLHYNLLLLGPRRRKQKLPLTEWSLLDHSLLHNCLLEKAVAEATVIVAPIKDLLTRAAMRQVVEDSLIDKGIYPSNDWLEIIEEVNLFAMYQQLFDILEDNSIPYRILFNADGDTNTMRETDRCYVHAALRGKYVGIPSDAEIDSVCAEPGAEYQAVMLPSGKASNNRSYQHTNGSRRKTFEVFRGPSAEGTSVLDIGCANGDILFWYERFGAEKLTGLDIKEKRLLAARKFGKLLRSVARFYQGDFLSFNDLEPHDDVLVLNVLHHVNDIRGFLAKASRLTSKRLIIEYPTLSDPKFGRLGEVPEGLEKFPLIGVSSSSVDQTFVFTGSALTRILADYGNFKVDLRPSPISHRQIAIFSRV